MGEYVCPVCGEPLAESLLKELRDDPDWDVGPASISCQDCKATFVIDYDGIDFWIPGV